VQIEAKDNFLLSYINRYMRFVGEIYQKNIFKLNCIFFAIMI